MSKEAKKCTVKSTIRYDNGDVLELEFPNLKPEVAIALLQTFNAHKLEPKA